MIVGTSTFGSDKKPLAELLNDISKGKMQLPDFQRDWVWDEYRVQSLLASVSMSYPIGAIMLLEAGNPDVKFKPRSIEGVNLNDGAKVEHWILDGQQRMTALYQALLSGKPVKTKNERRQKEILHKWFYIDMAKALDGQTDREDAIVIVNENKVSKDFRGQVIADYSTPESEFKAGLFPLSKIFDCSDWRTGYNEYWNYDPQKGKFFNSFDREVIKRFEQYQIPLITLRKETPKEAVCQVFERVNTRGVSLTVFELLTAIFASDEYNLREDWGAREKRIKAKVITNLDPVLKDIESTDLLQIVALLASYERKRDALVRGVKTEEAPGIGCKRRDILGLTLEEYRKWADDATKGLEKVAKFLISQNIFSPRDVPYAKQAVPLAAVFALLGPRADSEGIQTRLSRWYWCGVFGELYGSAIESRFAKDVPEVVNWIEGGPEPSSVSEADFSPGRLLTMRTRNSAAYNGLYALLMHDGAMDFRSGNRVDMNLYFNESIDIHHIFPVNWCEKNGIPRSVFNSIVNKTAISGVTNRKIGGSAPSVYLGRAQRDFEIDESRMNTILSSHLIPIEAMRKDDFQMFFKQRHEELLRRIETAMAKSVSREDFKIDLGLEEELEEDE